jgi:hypothetical protein
VEGIVSAPMIELHAMFGSPKNRTCASPPDVLAASNASSLVNPSFCVQDSAV